MQPILTKFDNVVQDQNAFKTKDGLFKWMVMPFELSNLYTTFIRFMNHILKLCIGVSMVVYFDDIPVYNKSEVEHLVHLR